MEVMSASQLQAGVLTSGEAVCCVPSTLVALCLNVKGLKRVEKSRALECLIPIFTTPNYLRALQVGPPFIDDVIHSEHWMQPRLDNKHSGMHAMEVQGRCADV